MFSGESGTPVEIVALHNGWLYTQGLAPGKDAMGNDVDLEGAISDTIVDFLDSGEMAVIEPVRPATDDRAYTEVEERIIELLDEEIRPAVATDGGDVTFERFEDGVVYLRLSGACGTCPSSVTTLKMGIERLMVEEIPEVSSVENVDALPEG